MAFLLLGILRIYWCIEKETAGRMSFGGLSYQCIFWMRVLKSLGGFVLSKRTISACFFYLICRSFYRWFCFSGYIIFDGFMPISAKTLKNLYYRYSKKWIKIYHICVKIKHYYIKYDKKHHKMPNKMFF